jgi:hypothetical protein
VAILWNIDVDKMIILKLILKKRHKEIIDFYYEDDTELINPLCGFSAVFIYFPYREKKIEAGL